MKIRNTVGALVHRVQLVVRKVSSAQTANLLEAQSEAGAVLARIGADGKLYGVGGGAAGQAIVGGDTAGGDLSGTYPSPAVAQASAAFALTGDLTPAQITASQNDYNPANLATASTLRLSSDAAWDITGLAGGADGRVLLLHNTGSFALTLKDESGSSAVANRFALSGDIVLSPDTSCLLQYDATTTRWRMAALGGISGSAGGDLSGAYPNPAVAQASAAFALTGDISPAQIGADQNDYNPAGLSTATTLRLSTDASRTLTGLAGGADGRLVVIHNVGGNAIVLSDENAASAAENRFALTGDVTLSTDDAVTLQYDTTTDRWRVIGSSKAGSAGAPTGAAGGDLGGTYPNPRVEAASEIFALEGDISPAQITANQNDYNPTNLATATTLRLSTDASRDITGLAGGADGRIIVIVNVGAQPIVLKDSSGSSAAANQFALTGDVTLNVDDGCVLQYDATSSRWRLIGSSKEGASGGGAPAAATYWVEDAHADLSAEVVVGTTGITTAAYGSRQAAAKAGRLFLPSDGFYIERDTGAAWAPWGPLFPMTPPVSGDFAWINQGSATVTTTNGGVFLTTPAEAANHRIRKKTAPAAPYTITMAFIPHLVGRDYNGVGAVWRQSSDGKLVTAGFRYNGAWQLYIHKWTSPTAYSASYADLGFSMQGPVLFLRIADDNTNRITSYSFDGINFNAVHTVGRTDFMTADEVGYSVNSNSSGYVTAMTLLSWKEA